MTPHTPQDEERLAAWHDAMNNEDVPPTEAETLSAEQKRQLADEQLLHSLLRYHYSESDASAARRVDRVLKAISPRPARPLWFRLARATLSSAAAMVLVVVLIQLLLPQTTSATSGFDRVVSTFLDDGDRTYSIQFTMQKTADDDDSDRPTADTERPHPMHRRGPGKLNGATLYLRGATQYAFEIKLPDDKSVWIGQDGQHAWAVRPNGAVLLSKDRDAFHLPFFEEMTTIPLIDVRDTLQTARQGYELDPPKKVTMDDGRGAEYFVAHREGQEGRRPRRIELWADPQTGLLYRMICSTMHFDRLVCLQLRMDYLEGKILPADWFEYRGHAPSDADVKTITREDIQRFRRQHHRMRQERWNRQPHRRPMPPGRDPSDMPPPPAGPEE